MKLHKGISLSVFLLGLMPSAFASQSPVMHQAVAPGKFYLGIFGGEGRTNSFNVSQFGTAFYSEAEGGPLAVNAFGDTSNRSAGIFGAQFGYQVQDIALHPRTLWTLAPAIEMEAYRFSNTSFTQDIINNTARLPEHDFVVTYPMTRNVFLANAVLNFNHPCFLLHPYLGLGIGGGVTRISGADATQVLPVESGVNHYNASTSDTDATFAGQVKLGLSYDINKCISVFAEYRWLYLSSTQYLFGSTVYPTHVETSSWQVQMDAQRSNIGTVGIRVNI